MNDAVYCEECKNVINQVKCLTFNVALKKDDWKCRVRSHDFLMRGGGWCQHLNEGGVCDNHEPA